MARSYKVSGTGEMNLRLVTASEPTPGTLHDANRIAGHVAILRSVMDCGGKRSATPLSSGQRFSDAQSRPGRAKAPSPLRSARALHDASVAARRIAVLKSVLD
jgi:hypothetical protein